MPSFRNACNVEISSDPATGKDRRLTVTCDLMTPNGPRRLSSSYNLEPLFSAIWQRALALHAQLHDATSVSGSLDTVSQIESAGLGDLYRRASKVVRRVAESSAVKTLQDKVKQVAPYVAEAAKLMPYGDTAVAVAEKAATLIKQARQGNREALRRIKAMTELANTGNAKAARVVESMRYINGELATIPAPDVSGWAFNHPFRSNFEALEMDSSNPRHVLRGAYYRGAR